MTTYGQVFGLPIVVTVPRKGCTYRTLYETILTQIDRCIIKLDANKGTDNEGRREEEEEEEDEDREEKEARGEEKDQEMKETNNDGDNKGLLFYYTEIMSTE